MSRIITADETELYVKDWGTGQSVILIHGWPLSSDSWDDQAMALAQAGYRALPMTGAASAAQRNPGAATTTTALADDHAAVMSLLPSARLNGHDPFAYLQDVLTRLPTQLNSRIEELLPHQWHSAGREQGQASGSD